MSNVIRYLTHLSSPLAGVRYAAIFVGYPDISHDNAAVLRSDPQGSLPPGLHGSEWDHVDLIVTEL